MEPTVVEIIKKNVAAIHTEGKLSLLERKLVNVLLLNAYDDLLTARTHTIPLKHLYALLSWEYASSIDTLKNALNRLTSTSIEFNLMQDGTEKWEVMSMLSYGSINDGVCHYRYDESLAAKLYDPEIYAKINIGMQRRFDGGYALTLYENCIRYKSIGTTGWWEIDKFRKIIGADSKIYDEFKYLKRNIITLSVNQINKVSDILLDVEYRRKKRKVTDIRFVIEDNPQYTLLLDPQIEEHLHITKSEPYKRLIDHGFKERLAFTWVLQDLERVQGVLDYVEEREKNQKLKGKPAGYIRKLIEDGVDVDKKTPYETQREANVTENAAHELHKSRQKLLDDQRRIFRTRKVTEVIKKLEKKQVVEFLNIYREHSGEGRIKSWDEKKGLLTDSLERMSFNAWLRGEISSNFTIDEVSD